MNFQLMIEILPDLLSAAVTTVQLVCLSLCFGMMLAIPLAVSCVSRHRFFSFPAAAYIFFFRGTPLLVQIFLVYYGLAQFEWVRSSFLWPYLRVPFVCALITFVLHTAAYTANILRGGYRRSMPGRLRRPGHMACPHCSSIVIFFFPRRFVWYCRPMAMR